MIEAAGLVKHHGEGRARRRILDGAAFSVAAGEVVAITGRSGDCVPMVKVFAAPS